MRPECDNLNCCHDCQTTNEEDDGLRLICKQCKHIYILRCDKDGRFNNREYQKIYRKDTLQPNTNLYYKYHGKMSII